MNLFRKKCAYCNLKIEKGKEISAEIKLPQFINPCVRFFCNEEHQRLFSVKNQGTLSSKSYCMNCDD